MREFIVAKGARLMAFWIKLQAQVQPFVAKVSAAVKPRVDAYLKPHLLAAKSRWDHLVPRDRKILQGGAAVVLPLILYALVWSPMTTAIEDLRVQLHHDQKQLAWLETADQQLRALAKNPEPLSLKTQTQRLNALQEKLQNSPYRSVMTQLTQTSADQIRVVFSPVDFDGLMGWMLAQQGEFQVEQATIKRLEKKGQVSVEMILGVKHA